MLRSWSEKSRFSGFRRVDPVKFLVDVGVGRAVETWLKDNGHDTQSVRDIDPHARDIDILRIAVNESRMVITMDKDFGELVHHSGAPHAGVLILRLEDARGQEKADVVRRILSLYGDKMVGKFCVYQDGRLRIR